MMKKYIVALLIFPWFVQPLFAQQTNNGQQREASREQKEQKESDNETRHELSGWINGGFSSLHYKPTIGDHSGGIGGGIGLGYTYMFDPKWGISTGLSFDIYHAKTKIDKYFDTYTAIDDEDKYNWMSLLVDIDKFQEKQRAYLLNIPVMLQYQASGNEENTFYAALGGKIGIPVRGKYKSEGTYLTKGKYEFTETIFEDMPEHGYNLYPGLTEDKKLKLNINVQLAVEAGYKWLLDEDWFLYAGLYCDYGLTDIRKNKDNTLRVLEYDRENPVRYRINSIAESSYSDGKTTSYYMKKMNTVSFGLKLKVAFKID